MSADRLLAHYGRIADAPDAIGRFRHFVLDLAVRGKLVVQDRKDERASELLKGLKKQLSEAPHTARRARENDTVEPPYSIPSNWLWVPIGEHLELINGMAFKPTDWLQTGIKIVRIQNLNRLDAPFNYCDPNSVRARVLIDDGAFLISWSGTPGTSFGAFIWDRGPAALNQHIFRCDFRLRAFDARYLRLAINGRLDEMIAKAHGGVGLQHITKGKLEALLIALPPLAEQRRIVAKVDELMALCAQLEAARTAREETRDRLTTGSLARLNAPDPDTFQEDARFALNVLPSLTARPEQIKQLRQAILNLAVRGKLVPQNPRDEPAANLVRRIEKEKTQLRTSGEKRKEPDLEDITADEVPFQPPLGWSWVRIGHLGETNIGLTYSPSDVAAVGIPVLRSSNIQNGKLDLEDLVRVRCEPKPSVLVREGDLLICARNGSRSLVGKVAIIENLAEPAAFGAFMAVFRSELNRYLYWFITSPLFRQVIDEVNTTTINQITQNNLRSTLVPLPPHAEQRRIVAKVDELMALCDGLEVSLTSGDDTRRRLLDCLLAEALSQGESRETGAVA